MFCCHDFGIDPVLVAFASTLQFWTENKLSYNFLLYIFSHFKTNFKMDLKVCTEAMGVLSYTKYIMIQIYHIPHAQYMNIVAIKYAF